MPVRDKALDEMVRLVTGHGNQAKAMKLALYHAADALYTKTLDSIDWKRVMHDAVTRHMALHDGDYLTSGLEDEHAVGEVCSECIHEALLANEWGGTARDNVWLSHPRSIRSTLDFNPATPEEVGLLLRWIGHHATQPDTAPEAERDEDGHLKVCEEVGRIGRERMLCHPACPHYDGWISDLAS